MAMMRAAAAAAARMKTLGSGRSLYNTRIHTTATTEAKVKDFILTDFALFHPSILRLIDAIGTWNGIISLIPFAMKSVRACFQKPPFKYKPIIIDSFMIYELPVSRYTKNQLSVEITPSRRLKVFGEIDEKRKTLYTVKLPPGEYGEADVEAKLEHGFLNVQFDSYFTYEESIPIVQEQSGDDSTLQRALKKTSPYNRTFDLLEKRYGTRYLFEQGFGRKPRRSFSMLPSQVFGRRSYATLPTTTESLLLCIGSVLVFKGSKYLKAKLCKRPQPSIHIASGFGNSISCLFDIKGLDMERVSCEIVDERKLIVYCPHKSTRVKIPVYTVDLPTGSYSNAIIRATAEVKKGVLTVLILDYKTPPLKMEVLSKLD